MNDVMNKIKELRISKGFSHQNMANDLGISQAAYTKLEKNETKLTVDRLFQIAKILETPDPELIGAAPATVYNQNNGDNATGDQQQVVHLYQENKETTQDFIHSLKQEIQHLKEENIKLFDILGKKKFQMRLAIL